MATSNVGRLPVMENGKMVGIVTRSDFTKLIRTKIQAEKETAEIAEAIRT
jgi:predicted transcriptional regulator